MANIKSKIPYFMRTVFCLVSAISIVHRKMFAQLYLANRQTSQHLKLPPSFKIAHFPAEAVHPGSLNQSTKEAVLLLNDAHGLLFIISAFAWANASACAAPRLRSKCQHLKFLNCFKLGWTQNTQRASEISVSCRKRSVWMSYIQRKNCLSLPM